MAKLSVDTALLKAKSHIKKGEIEEAKKLYQAVLEVFPKNKMAQQGLAALNKPKQSAAIQSPPQDTINQLIDLYKQGQLAAVVEQAQAITEQYPEAFIIWNILGAAYKGLGRVQAASEAFKKVTELNPTYADGFSNLGAHLQDQGKLDEAIASYETALSLKPDHADAFNNMGTALKKQGKLEDAIEAYKKALSFKPDHAEAYNNMGNALKDQGKLEDAIEVYKKALSFKPDHAEAYNNMGNALKDQGKLDEALYAYNQAITLRSNYHAPYLNMGNTFMQLKRFEDAEIAYNKVLSLNPWNAKAHYALGVTLEVMNKQVKALAAFKAAIGNDENFKNRLWIKLFNLQRETFERIVYNYLNKDNFGVLGSPNWLIEQEKKYGGLVQGIRRNNLSIQENKSSFQLVHGHTGGDRMDFGPNCHGYSVLYCHAINSYLNNVSKKADDPSLKIAEIGILNGSGLAIWSDWFKNAELFGFDLDLAIFHSNRQFLLEQGAFQRALPKVSEIDQYDITSQKISDILQGEKINIAIDDGAHTELSIINTFSAFKSNLAYDFLYFIEDNWNTISFLQPLFSDIKIKQFGEMAIVFPKHLNLLDKLESIDDMLVLLGLDPIKFWR